MLSRSNTTFRIGHITTIADNLKSQIEHLLTWGELTEEERGMFTRAANAADIAVARMRKLDFGKVHADWL